MPWSEYWLIVAALAITILIFRVAPLLLLSGRELPESIERALNFVPVAAFAALVANDLVDPAAWVDPSIHDVIPLIAALPVIVIALKTRSLAACIIAGVGFYALLAFTIGA